MYLLGIKDSSLMDGSLYFNGPKKKKVFIFGLQSRSSIHTFIELFLDDIYKISTIPKEAPLVVDFGANLGMFLLASIYFGISPKYYVALEPMPDNLKKLRENLSQLKDISHIVIPKAVSNKDGQKLEFIFNHTGSTKKEYGHESKISQLVEVSTISLPTIMEQIPLSIRVDTPVFLKMDIEGGEWDFEKELLDFLTGERSIKYIAFELHTVEALHKGDKEIIEFSRRLESAFDFRMWKEGGNVFVLVGKRKG